MDLATLVLACAPSVAPATMLGIIDVESSGNPHAIGVVGARLERQPETLAEAVATAHALERAGRNYSVGLAQVNRQHFARFGFESVARAFEPCASLAAGAQILGECHARAVSDGREGEGALAAALSCYYTGDLDRGQRARGAGPSYAARVLERARSHLEALTRGAKN